MPKHVFLTSGGSSGDASIGPGEGGVFWLNDEPLSESPTMNTLSSTLLSYKRSQSIFHTIFWCYFIGGVLLRATRVFTVTTHCNTSERLPNRDGISMILVYPLKA